MEKLRPWRRLLFGVTAGLLGVVLHLVFGTRGPDIRPTPSLAALPWLLLAVFAVLAIASGWAFVRGAHRRWVKVVVGLSHVTIVLGGLAGIVTSDPEFPFGSTYADSLDLPGGRGTAYLYEGGLFCTRTLWIAPPGSMWANRVEGWGLTCKYEAELTWDESKGQPRAVGPDGKPVPSPPTWDKLFVWSPH